MNHSVDVALPYLNIAIPRSIGFALATTITIRVVKPKKLF